MVLSENPIHDTGGGQRSAQLALELVERDSCVLFVSRGVVTETVDLGLSFDHPRLVETSLSALMSSLDDGALREVFALPEAWVLTQPAVEQWLGVLERARAAGVITVYDCVDRWSSELGRGWYRRGVERRIAQASRVLTASAPELVEHVERLTERETHLVPNAFSSRIFDARKTYERPADLPSGGRVALFVGALWGGWLDWSLVRESATAYPETSFVFIGDHRREGRGLPANCTFLGLKAQTALPPYLAHADVAFLPWHTGGMTESMSPLTVYEHVAMGLPVVATPIDPLKDVPGVVMAGDGDAFIAALGATARESLSESERRKMSEFAARNSWVPRVDRLLELVRDERSGRIDRARGSRQILSVVVPAYNHERFIGEALDSVAAQTLPAGEVLVVDDGSSDATREVIAAHSFEGLRLLPQRNRGAHAAINRAIALSGGEYVAILNSDDAFEPERLEHAWAVARATGAALVFGTVRLIDDAGKPLSPDHPTSVWYRRALAEAVGAPSLKAGLRHHNVAATTSNFFLHKELWRRLGGFRAYRYVHDFDFLLRALDLVPERVCFADELSDVRYRVHGDNTITEDTGAALTERDEMRAGLGGVQHMVRVAVARRRDSPAVRAAVDTTAVVGPTRFGTADGAASLRAGLVVPELDSGGLEEVVALLARTLPAVGVDVSVLCTQAGGTVADRLLSAGVEVTVGEGRPEVWRTWAMESRPDVLSTHFAARVVTDVLAECGAPVVETIHNTYAWFTPDDWRNERAKLDRVTATIAVSDVVARYADRHDLSGPGRSVISNAVHPARAARLPQGHARRLFGLQPEIPVFVSHGRLSRQKNPEGLLAAFADVLRDVPDARLLLAGPADTGFDLRGLRRRYSGLFRARSVQLLPPVRSVGALLSAADAFVSDSFFEGWSVAASEALWVGLPVVLSDCGGARDLVGDGGERGIVVPNPLGDPLAASPDSVSNPPEHATAANREALTKALVAVAEDRDRWHGRADAIRGHAREVLAPLRMASQYADVFRSVTERRTP